MSHKSQMDDDSSEFGGFREDPLAGREEVPRYASPPVQPAYGAPHAAPPGFAPTTEPPPPRPSILRRPLSTEPLGPNNPAPLPSRYR